MDDQNNNQTAGVQSPAPVAGRPLTAEDRAALRPGDLVQYADYAPFCIGDHGITVDSVMVSVERGERHTFIGRPDAFGPDRADECSWSHSFEDHDIIAFRLSRPASEQTDARAGYEQARRDFNRMRDDGSLPDDQPVKAIGAGREALIADLKRFYDDCTPSQMEYRHSDGLAFALEKAITALSPASPARTPMGGWDHEICVNCTSSETISEIKAAGHVSCCPERRMVSLRDLSDAYAAQQKPPMGGEVEALREALIQADLKIRSLSGTDQSDVEFIRQALAASSPSPAQGGEDLAGKLKAIRDRFLMPTPDKDHTDYAVMTRCAKALDAFEWLAGLYNDRQLTREDVANELHDYRVMIENVPKVYDHLTGGRLSKPTYAAGDVISVANDYINDLVEDEIKDRAALSASPQPEAGEV